MTTIIIDTHALDDLLEDRQATIRQPKSGQRLAECRTPQTKSERRAMKKTPPKPKQPKKPKKY